MSKTLTPLVWSKKELKLWKQDLSERQQELPKFIEIYGEKHKIVASTKKNIRNAKRMVKIFERDIKKLRRA